MEGCEVEWVRGDRRAGAGRQKASQLFHVMGGKEEEVLLREDQRSRWQKTCRKRSLQMQQHLTDAERGTGGLFSVLTTKA